MIEPRCIFCGSDWNSIALYPRKGTYAGRAPICSKCASNELTNQDIINAVKKIEKENELKFQTYQIDAHRTSIHHDTFRLTPNQVYALTGLSNECGELSGVLKKALRGDYGDHPASNPAFLKKIRDEGGDVLWNLAEVFTQFGISMPHVAAENIEKLRDRQERGVIMGEGSER